MGWYESTGRMGIVKPNENMLNAVMIIKISVNGVEITVLPDTAFVERSWQGTERPRVLASELVTQAISRLREVLEEV